MIKLEITIKELTSIDLEKATVTQIGTKEIEKNASKNEMEVSNLLKKRLGIDEKFQVVTEKDELKAELEKLLKSL